MRNSYVRCEHMWNHVGVVLRTRLGNLYPCHGLPLRGLGVIPLMLSKSCIRLNAARARRTAMPLDRASSGLLCAFVGHLVDDSRKSFLIGLKMIVRKILVMEISFPGLTMRARRCHQ